MYYTQAAFKIGINSKTFYSKVFETTSVVEPG